jgi:hypothetical protein
MDEFLGYLEEHEETMRVFYRSLLEDHRRRYAATALIVTPATPPHAAPGGMW